eukprot:scaffold610_cov352-Pavlova_lutheri.AAC.14
MGAQGEFRPWMWQGVDHGQAYPSPPGESHPSYTSFHAFPDQGLAFSGRPPPLVRPALLPRRRRGGVGSGWLGPREWTVGLVYI